MLAELTRRLLSTAVVVLGVVVLVFLLIHLIPGDPVDVMLGEAATAADREALRHQLGLDRPLTAQLGDYLGGLARGDLGQSLQQRRPIGELLAERIPATLELALAALAFTLVLALPLGLLAAVRRNSGWDRGAMAFSLLGVSIPNFWLGPLLILLFAVGLGWLPVSGRDAPGALILPALTLGLSLAAVLSRMVRSSVLEVLGEDFIRSAYARGLSTRQVLTRHALPNALLPVITVLGLQLGTLLAGAVITEVVFGWPGLGSLTIEAIQGRDYPLVQACVLLISLSYVLVNMLTDLLYAGIDPRIRLGAD
ncbi:ABC-type dipeptide/oligopeptide/nickel transporter, permease components [Thiohalobacter thiocyanaticus]|uniref:ABC-type dipeptide/oligopeptide/nickel transporter, permease components n=1 Tax=Thiohalobacter thiocyanaticus TaxID=585455 RepID=A0A1Z4VSY0_9GAMM|nr:nickel ABC transporter permease [Thiohalobacter thiocyanaticus]BAZ94512.1 ABC-type dipeptide/oligopeptide/nickel transporter, permease components [Thiohalobacter thiocyanaticus]